MQKAWEHQRCYSSRPLCYSVTPSRILQGKQGVYTLYDIKVIWLVCSYFLFLPGSVLVGCTFVRICPPKTSWKRKMELAAGSRQWGWQVLINAVLLGGGWECQMERSRKSSLRGNIWAERWIMDGSLERFEAEGKTPSAKTLRLGCAWNVGGRAARPGSMDSGRALKASKARRAGRCVPWQHRPGLGESRLYLRSQCAFAQQRKPKKKTNKQISHTI